MRNLVLVLLIVLFSSGLKVTETFSQQSVPNKIALKPVLPLVFQLGEFDKQYENTVPGYQPLLDACDGDMNMAYNKLLGMMQEMENYSRTIGYDLNGINAWMHFFWSENGDIEHIGFYLKPNSRNVNTDQFRQFLAKFVDQYKFPLRSKVKFSLYSSFSFPIAHP